MKSRIAALTAALCLLCIASAGVHAFAVSYEYYNAKVDHYFRTASYDEAVFLDGLPDGGWVRTGNNFVVGATDMPGNAHYTFNNDPATIGTGGAEVPVMKPVCRFFSAQSISHFYTVDPDECAMVKVTWPDFWKYEGIDFTAVGPVGGACPVSAPVKILRAYNRKVDGNHRYTADPAIYNSMMAKGWAGEGTVMCAFSTDPVQAKALEQLLLFRGQWLMGARDQFNFTGLEFDYHPNTIDRFALRGNFTNGSAATSVWSTYTAGKGFYTHWIEVFLGNFYYNVYYNLVFATDTNHVRGCFDWVKLGSNIDSCQAVAGTRQ